MSIDERSKSSLAFQSRWEGLRLPGVLVPKSADIELTHFGEFLPLLIKVELDLASRTMLIRLVGSLIRDIVGMELTGTNYLDLVENEEAEAGWQNRHPVHNHPCGRYEVVHMRFPGKPTLMGSLTTLPMFGAQSERLFLVLGEPMTEPPRLEKGQTGGNIIKDNNSAFFDLGAGVPDDRTI